MTRALPTSLLLASVLTGVVCAQTHLRSDQTPPELEAVGVTEKLGQKVDLNLQFVAEDGYPKPLANYFQKGRPVLLILGYYTCPMLCNLVLNGTTSALREIPWTPGNEYEIVTISIDPAENFGLARSKKASYLESFERPAPGWHFLTDYNGSSKRIADQVGFGYRWDERSSQYAHAAVIMVLTPEGKVSRYLYGHKPKPFDLRLAFTEAAKEKFGMTTERIMLYCFQYDPLSKSYVLFARNIMRLGGVLTIIAIFFVLRRLWRKEKERGFRNSETLVTAK